MPSLSQRRRPTRQALLHGPCADGESPWAGRRCDAHPATGTAEREAAIELIVRALAGSPTRHLGRRQGLRRSRTSSCRLSGPAHCSGHVRGTGRPRLRHRWPRDAPSWLCCQPNRSQADRGGVRLDQGVGGLHKTKLRGVSRVSAEFIFAMAAYNLIRLPRLFSTAA